MAQVAANASDAGVRMAAVAKLTDKAALVEVAMTDGHSETRLAAAEKLAGLKDSRSVDPLIRALADSPGRAAAALAEIGDRRAFQPLLEWMVTRMSTWDQGAHSDRLAVARALVAFARTDPALRTSVREALRPRQSTHTDRTSGHPADCQQTHTDSHTDLGVNLDELPDF